MRKPKIEGLAGIDKGIKSLAGVGKNLNERVQDIAVAIIDHADNAGNGDVSRALILVQTVKRLRTLNTAYLVGFFRYFGNCNVNLAADNGKGKVSLIAKDSKAYRGGFDVQGAKHNNWYDAIDENGDRAKWYSGPEPAEFQPFTVGDLAARMRNFVERTEKWLSSTTEVKGKTVPTVMLSEDDAQQVHRAMRFIEQISNTLARHGDVEKLKAEAEKLEKMEDPEPVKAVLRAAA